MLFTAIIGVVTPSAANAQVTSAAGGGAASAQSLRQVWPAGADTAWAWTQGETLGSAQALDRTVNGGRTWSTVTPPGLSEQSGDHVITGFYALDATHAWATYGSIDEGTPQTITATSDGGRRWTTVATAPLPDFDGYLYNCGLDFVTPADGWCVSTPVSISDEEAVFVYRTTDGGRKWRLISSTTSEPPPSGALPLLNDKNIQFTGPETGWAVSDELGPVTASLYETLNGGRTWVRRAVAMAPGMLENGSAFSGLPVLAGAKGAVGYTIDGGSAPVSASAVSASAGPDDAAPGEKTIVYVTTDNGASWHVVTPPGGPEGWLVDTITPRIWRLVDGDRILATDNAGKTWRTIKSGHTFTPLFYPYDEPTPPTVSFANSRTGWIADTTAVSTTLWRTTDGGSSWREITVPGT